MASLLERLHREQPFDIVHASYTHGALAACLFQLAYNVPYLLHLHGGEHLKAREAGWKAHYFRLSMANAARLLTTSAHLVAELLEFAGAKAPPVDVIPGGAVDDRYISSREIPKGAAMRAIGLEGEAPVILFVGRMHPLKGPHILLDSLPKIWDRLPHARCVLVGDGPLLKKLKDRAVARGRADQVHWLGHQHPASIPKIMRAADLIVIPSTITEPNGNLVGLEAMAADVPLVVTRVGELPNFVRDGMAGLVIEPNRPDELSRAVIRILTDGELRYNLRMSARDVIVHRTWSRVVEKVEAAYSQCLEDWS